MRKLIYYLVLFGTGSGTKGSGENLEKSIQSQNTNVAPSEQKKPQHPSGNPVKNYVLEQLAKLMTTCIIIRIDDFTLYKVTTTSRNPIPKEFITGITYFLYIIYTFKYLSGLLFNEITFLIKFTNNYFI